MVLRQENGYSLVQYVTNPQNDGTNHVIFKRGWVLSSYLSYSPKTSLTTTQGTNKFYIRNAATGLYLDVQSYSISDGANIHIWEYHGGYNQEWILDPVTTTKGSTYVRLLTNMAQAQSKGIQVASDAPILNSDITLLTKAAFVRMQFVIEPTNDGYYYIRSRRGANFFVLGVDPSDSGSGGEVYLKYPTSSLYNKWSLEPAYEEGADFSYLNSGLPSSTSVSYGFNITFEIIDPSNNAPIGLNYDLIQYTTEGIKSWESDSRRFTLNTSGDSNNTIYINYTDSPNNTQGPIYGQMTPYIYANSGKLAYCEIELFYKNILNDFGSTDLPNVWKSVVAHEIGHALSLDDMDKNNQQAGWPVMPYSIMSKGRDRTLFNGPHKCDIAGVKKNYMS